MTTNLAKELEASWELYEEAKQEWRAPTYLHEDLRPLPVEGEVIGRSRVTGLVDRGEGKGALMYSEREVVDAKTGEMGGCPMGRNEREGVVDPYGEVFGYPGLYVADGSVMPGPVGANPSLTIAANALRVGAAIAGGRAPAGAVFAKCM